jgi:pimeloyl-ACP methyl ester carboxylesterase
VESLHDDDSTALAELSGGDQSAAVATLQVACEPIRALLGQDDDAVADAFGALMSPRDLELLRQPRLRAAFVAGTRESLRQGTSGYAHDNLSWLPNWSFELRDVACPVHLWYGTDDRFAPLEHGRYLADHLPHAELTVRAGEGHLGVIEHLAEVLVALTA